MIECVNILITVTKYSKFVINYPIMLLALCYETLFFFFFTLSVVKEVCDRVEMGQQSQE